MNAKNSEVTSLPPYVSYRTFRNFLEQMHEGIPSRIDRSVMGSSMAGGTVTQLLTGLKALNLISEDGRPEPALGDLASATGEERQSILKAILQNAYPNVFQLDLTRASSQEFREKFKEFSSKDDVVNKCQAFFRQAAEDAGMELSPYIKERTRTTGQPRRRRKTKGADPGTKPERQQPSGTTRSIEEMILQKYPEFSPEWSSETQESWMKGIMRLYEQLRGEQEEEESAEDDVPF